MLSSARKFYVARSGFQQREYYPTRNNIPKTNSSSDNRESAGGSPTSINHFHPEQNAFGIFFVYRHYSNSLGRVQFLHAPVDAAIFRFIQKRIHTDIDHIRISRINRDRVHRQGFGRYQNIHEFPGSAAV